MILTFLTDNLPYINCKAIFKGPVTVSNSTLDLQNLQITKNNLPFINKQKKGCRYISGLHIPGHTISRKFPGKK
jgi:hypothetical protein